MTSGSGADNPPISGTGSDDSLAGDAGNDSISGGEGNDTLSGEAGNDTLAGDAGNDSLSGGAGSDTADYSAAESGVNADLAAGLATSTDSQQANIANAGFEDEVLADNAYVGPQAPVGWTGVNEIGTWNPTGQPEAGVTGQNVANLNGQSSIEQTLSETFSSINSYKLTLRISDYAGGGDATDVTVNLYAGGTVIGTYTFNPDEGVWHTIDVEVDGASVPGGAALDGQPLRIEVVNNSAPWVPGTQVWNDINVDDVSLTVYRPDTDSLSEVENLKGSAFGDTLGGNAADNRLAGEGGNDLINGDAGNDTLTGGTGDDTLEGGTGDDTLAGGSGDDVLQGGAGSDTADYSAAESGVNADLSTGLATSTYGQEATIVNAGFEDEVLADGAHTGVQPPPGWTGVNQVNTWNPAGQTETGVTGQNVSSLNGQSSIEQTLSETFASTNSYKLTLRISDYAGGGDATDVTVNLYAGGTVIGTYTFNPDEGVWNTINVEVDGANVPGGAMLDGQPLRIEVVNNSAPWVPGTEVWNDINVDDVSLTVYRPDTDSLSGVENLKGSAFGDTLGGNAGDNRLAGEGGNDVISGGAGNDTLEGGTGNDSLTGGAGDDSFILASGAGDDRIADFTIGTASAPLDRLDISDLTKPDGSPVTWRDVVVTDDGAGNSRLSFPGGESVLLEGVSPTRLAGKSSLMAIGVPCFTPGAAILTPSGDVPVETLRAGDLVCTLDNGPQRVLWAGRRDLVDPAENHCPVLIRAGAFGNRRDLLVSPQHAMLVPLDGQETGLARARHLAEAGHPGVQLVPGTRRVSYIHLLFERHELIFAEGAVTESFFPGAQGLGALDLAARSEILGLFPELAFRPAELAYGARVRAALRRADLRRKGRLRLPIAPGTRNARLPG